ncbi:MAG TPA: FkbM family methyltransferase [Crinalium sp.]|jgi:FkbM family methyltransferase
MSSLSHDLFWKTLVNFIKSHSREGDRIIAPVEFRKEFPNAFTYSFAQAEGAAEFQWVIVHKGMIQKLDSDFLNTVIQKQIPVFANEVFVVFTSHSNIDELHPNSVHMRPFWEQVAPDRIQPENASIYLLRKIRYKSNRFKQTITQVFQQRKTSAKVDEALIRLERLEKQIKELDKTIRKQRNPIRQIKDIVAMLPSEFAIACRAACHTAYLGNGVLLCRILGRLLVYADANDIGIVPHLSLNGYWESGITLTTVRILQPGWHCLDVGANHGYFALLMAEIVGPTGRVFAMEPNPKLVELLRRSLEANGFEKRAAVIPKAASHSDGETLNLVIPKGQTGHASVAALPSSTDDVVAVETITIDTLTADWPQVNFVKVDAEGAEEDIWNGMRQTIEKNKDIVVVLEFGASRYANPRAFLESIEQSGFILRYIDVFEIKPITIERCLTERPDSFWMLFLQRW